MFWLAYNTPKLAHGTSKITAPPPMLGADTDAVLSEIGYDGASIARLRQTKAL